jgi:polyisoprenoid-binding protein YceI
MVHLDASSAQCVVFTFKEGLLSPVAHDLKIRVTKFVIDADEATRKITAQFDAASLRVVCAMNDGKEVRGSLTTANKREIEGNIVREVLDVPRYPAIRFVSTGVEEEGGAYAVKGKLALHGHERQVRVQVREDAGHYIAEARIHQPDFGIRPYTALFGALKVRPEVLVRIVVPATPRQEREARLGQE